MLVYKWSNLFVQTRYWYTYLTKWYHMKLEGFTFSQKFLRSRKFCKYGCSCHPLHWKSPAQIRVHGKQRWSCCKVSFEHSSARLDIEKYNKFFNSWAYGKTKTVNKMVIHLVTSSKCKRQVIFPQWDHGRFLPATWTPIRWRNNFEDFYCRLGCMKHQNSPRATIYN